MLDCTRLGLAGLLAALALAGTIGVARAGAAVGEPISGAARVVDGDTMAIADTRLRLEGIDAPEAGQTCARAWLGRWACGAAARTALARLVEGREVVCEHRGPDRYGRVLGLCRVEGRDIGAQMVRQGLAWAFVRYSLSYVREEAEARAAGRGIWQAATEPAWDYRAGRWEAAQASVPDGCAIKGNVSRHGHIYHLPWSPWYAHISIEPAHGERWFCSEAEALAAGWRAAMGR